MVQKISDINNGIMTNAQEYIARCDNAYTESICSIAKEIGESADKCPVILISGPSGSGKTTSAAILEGCLEQFGHMTHVLSLDDFFQTMTEEQKLLAAEGKIDLESPERIDKPYLEKIIADIIACRPFRVPCFDFKNSRRNETERVLERKPGELVVVEGIHALNPDVINIDGTVGVYVSVRTRVQTPSGDIIHPEYIRLMRRMLRDRTHRGRSFTDTAKKYKSVQAGENKFIMPFKHNASYDIDTFIPYELNVYRNLLLEGLTAEGLDKKVPALMELIDDATPLDVSAVSKHSLIREFIPAQI